MVMFTVVSAAELHADIESLIRRRCGEISELTPLLQSLEIRACLFIDPRGDPVNEFILTEESHSTEAAKPWWRFW